MKYSNAPREKTTLEQKRVLLLMQEGERRHRMRRLLSSQLQVAGLSGDSMPGEVDLIICDESEFARLRGQIEMLKEGKRPQFLPVLLVLSPKAYEEAIDLAWNVADEVIRAPLRTGELASRMTALLRARRYSLQAQKQKRKLARKDEKLQESEERWRHLVEQHPEAVVISARGQVIYANKATAELIGASSAQELNGRHLREFVAESQYEVLEERLGRLEEGRSLDAFQYEVHTTGGQRRTVDVTSSVVNFGGLQVIQSVARDVTGAVRSVRH